MVGRSTDELFADMGAFWRTLVGDSQLRWIGPEKGVIHLATAAVVNAVWDLVAKRAGKPLWKLLVDMTPEELVALVDFRYITDALTPERGPAIAASASPRPRGDREAELRRDGYPAYTTSVGWLGYDDDKIRRLCREALAEGWTRFKMKVGADVEDDLRRARIVREEIGPDAMLAVDANQRWDVDEAIAWMARLAAVRPVLDRGADQPRRHPRPRGDRPRPWRRSGSRPASTSTTGSCSSSSSRPDAIGVCQIDACRLGGVNEVLAVLLLAAKFGVPVCPHAGGVGLCELVQHLSAFDYVAVSGALDGRMIEYVDHLHEHFLDPVVDPRRPLRRADRRPATAPRCGRSRWRGSPIPTGRSGRRTARREAAGATR